MMAGVRKFRGSFQARVWRKGQDIHLGTFSDEKQAEHAVLLARSTLGLREHVIPASTAAEIVAQYSQGKGRRAVAAHLGVSATAVLSILKDHGIPRRKLGEANRGPRHPAWKGDAASYSALHFRVYRLRGNPSRCDDCGTENAARLYEWANISGRYGDPNDYKRLCRACHRRFDFLRREAGR